MKEIVPLAVVTEKGGMWASGSPSGVFPVRTKGWYPVTWKEYATRAAKETTRALRARTGGETVSETRSVWVTGANTPQEVEDPSPAWESAWIQATVWQA